MKPYFKACIVRLLLMIVLADAAGAKAMASGLLDHWQVRHPEPLAVSLSDVTCWKGAFYAAGGGGTILRSETGTDWFSLDTPTDGELWSFYATSGALFAVGDSPPKVIRENIPTILRSTDGYTWSKFAAPEGSLGFRELIYTNGVFVAVGLHGMISSSVDGSTWQTHPEITFANLLGLAYGNGTFVATSAEGQIATSRDGQHWSGQLIQGVRVIRSVIFANGSFLAVADGSKLLYSDDGLSWNIRSPAIPRSVGYTLSFANGLYFATGYSADPDSGVVNVSSNAVDWTTIVLERAAGYNAVTFANGRYVMVGSPTSLLICSDPFDPASWQSVVARTFYNSFTGIAAGGGKFVAVGPEGTIASSPGGSTWRRETPPKPSHFAGVAYGNGKFVAAGNAPGLIATSTDGSNWTAAERVPATNVVSVLFANNLFLVGGWGGLTYSSWDGVSWEEKTIAPQEAITGLAYGNGVFLCTSASGNVRTSTDGVKWSEGKVLQSTSCAFGAGKFMAAGSGGSYYTSPDGIHWTGHQRPETLFGPEIYLPEHITYLRDAFLYFGTIGSSGSGLYSSPDALNWTRRFPRCGNNPQGFAWASDTFVMIAGSSILQSGDSFSFSEARYEGDGFALQLKASDTNSVLLESSADLRRWDLATNAVRTGSLLKFPGETQRFYRARATNQP